MATTLVAPTGLAQQAADIVEQALRAGASDAEVVIREGDEFEASVRMGELETLKDSGSRAIGLRVFLGKHAANTSSSDFSPSGIRHLIDGALALARVSSPDPLQGLPDSFGQLSHDLELYYDDVYSLPVPERIEIARRVEAASLAADARISNSAGGSFDAATGHKVMANSRGFVGEYRTSYCGFSASPIAAGKSGEMQRDYWYSSARSFAGLESPEEIGAIAAARTVRRLDGRSVPTQRVPIIFPPEIARSLLGSMAEAASGDAIYRGASFFSGKLGEQVAAPTITVIDDGTLPGRFGSVPFDGDGQPTQRTVLIENGILRSYLLNTYVGRQLGMPSTANASRGLAGNPGITTHNLFLASEGVPPATILAGIKSGFYVVELIGRGINMVTGDYSRGAAGLWIENGELTYAVQEITIAGNLKEMFRNITAIGDDMDFRSSITAPTLRIDGMTIAGSAT